jgi:signal transduction histidine kinase
VSPPRRTVRARLTALHALLVVAAMAAVLAVSYGLMRGHLLRTLPEPAARDVLGRLAGQYGLALAGTVLLAGAVGWFAAGRMLAPVKKLTATARRISEDRLDERIALQGPDDELRELADTIDAMLDRLQAAVEGQRRFVANASHELRSPLTVIRTEADVTLSDPEATVADLRRMGQSVLEASDRLDALLDALMVLALGRRGVLAREPLDLALAGRRAAADAARAAADGGVRLELHVAPAPVVGDRALLGRLAENLLDNAVRYNQPGGVVELHTVRSGDRARLRVVNSGPIVPPSEVQRLTEPFERLGRHGDGRGAGLGLSIVRAVAEAHGGDVCLAARPQGGLDVTVELPLQA